MYVYFLHSCAVVTFISVSCVVKLYHKALVEALEWNGDEREVEHYWFAASDCSELNDQEQRLKSSGCDAPPLAMRRRLMNSTSSTCLA